VTSPASPTTVQLAARLTAAYPEFAGREDEVQRQLDQQNRGG